MKMKNYCVVPLIVWFIYVNCEFLNLGITRLLTISCQIIAKKFRKVSFIHENEFFVLFC